MKGYLLFIFCWLSFLIQAYSAFSQAAPAFAWAKGAGNLQNDFGNAIALDASGNVYVVGDFQNSITFGTTTMQGSGGTDIYLVKFDPAGNVLWARKAGGLDDENGYDIAVDAAGNAFITGNFQATATFGTTTLTASGTTNSQDAFVAKFDTNGNFGWAIRLGGTGPENGSALTLDAAGNIYLAGTFQGLTVIGSNTFNNSTGYVDSFISKLDPTGSVIWVKRNGGSLSGDDLGNGIALDGSGNILLTGLFAGTTTFGTISLVNAGSTFNYDMFIAKYDPSGNIIWAKKGGGIAQDRANSIAVDGSGNSYITGQFQGQATFGTTTLTSGGTADILIAKYDAAGNEVWVKQAGSTTGTDGGNGIGLDGSGNLYITGGFTATAQFGTLSLLSDGDLDVFVAKYDASGNPLWVKQAGGSASNDIGGAIAVDNSGNSFITGSFFSEAYFDGLSITTAMFSPTVQDMFVAKLGNTPVPCVIPGVTISAACSGKNQIVTFTLTGQAPYRVFYNRNTTAQVINTNNSTFTVTVPNSTSTETFTLTGISSGNCFATATGSVVLTPLPRPQFAGSSGCAGPRTLTVTGASAGSTYNWYTSATATTPIAGVTTGTYSIPNLTTTTSYYVSIVDASGCESPRTTVTATVSAVPTGSVPPSRTVCASSAPFTLTPAVPAGGVWSGPGVTPAGVFTPSYTMSGPQVLTYTFNPAGCPGTATTTVTVNPGPATPTITFIAPDTLMASSAGTNYEWKLNGSVIPGSTQKLKVSVSGLYSVKAIGAGNCGSQYSPDYNHVVSGLNEDLAKRINLYPNPTTGIIHVELQEVKATHISVINMLGQEVVNQTVSKSDQKPTISLNLAGMVKGLYLVQIKTDDGVLIKRVAVE